MDAVANIEWLCSNGEIYHRTCVHWTAAIDAGKCERCGDAIPEPMMRLARLHRAERERRVRDREALGSLKSISQRSAEMEAKTDATLRRTSSGLSGQKPGKKG